LEYLQAGDWPAAEGALLHVRQRKGPDDLAVADALAYALLMQGDYRGCAQVLEPVLSHPQRSFWIQHKAGDARRGLHQPEAAAAHYRQALAEGSTSTLTARNLLQVLHGLAPQQALAELEQWPHPLPVPWLEGAQAAAALVPGLELVAWLEARGWATPALQRRLLEQKLYGLEPVVVPGLGPTQDGDHRWCVALQQRLRQLQLNPEA
jgi:hypothetical protein